MNFQTNTNYLRVIFSSAQWRPHILVNRVSQSNPLRCTLAGFLKKKSVPSIMSTATSIHPAMSPSISDHQLASLPSNWTAVVQLLVMSRCSDSLLRGINFWQPLCVIYGWAHSIELYRWTFCPVNKHFELQIGPMHKSNAISAFWFIIMVGSQGNKIISWVPIET